jgi:hypothetical protein
MRIEVQAQRTGAGLQRIAQDTPEMPHMGSAMHTPSVTNDSWSARGIQRWEAGTAGEGSTG